LIYRVHNYHPVNTTIFQFRCVLFQKIFSPGQKGQHTHTRQNTAEKRLERGGVDVNELQQQLCTTICTRQQQTANITTTTHISPQFLCCFCAFAYGYEFLFTYFFPETAIRRIYACPFACN